MPIKNRNVIHPLTIDQVTAPNLEPGMLIPEGVVLRVHHGPSEGCLVETILGPVEVDPGQRVPVFAKLTPEAFEPILEEVLRRKLAERG